jgi:hypothetical protein|tara:strand:- start:18 stop:941 length:924 start_codon:yes stop_codon:yes gene_type:complete
MNMPKEETGSMVRAGRTITLEELEGAREMVRLCSGLSRKELAQTVCEHWNWVTATGSHKETACLDLLEELEDKGQLRLPGKRKRTRWSTERASGAVRTRRTDPGTPEVGELATVGLVWLEVVEGKEERQLWNEYVDRYHYLGYRQPFGCFLRYFIRSEAGLLGCVMVAGAAKAIQARDQWIGWKKPQRQQNVPWVINNTRLLIFRWVEIRHLASHVLGQLATGVREDWQRRWGYRPLLLETFVDPARFSGTCYRAAGWIELGRTTGRGLRRKGQAYCSTPKLIYLKALAKDFRERLCGHALQGRTQG